MDSKTSLLNRIEFVLKNSKIAIESATLNNDGGLIIDTAKMTSFKSSGLALILDIYSIEHPYYLSFKYATQYGYLYNVESGVSIINNIKTEVENGWVLSFKSLVSAEIFSDFLEMAYNLLETNYKDAAAVMIGSVIEEHIRQLCMKSNIEISFEKEGKKSFLKADRMNQELVKANIYNVLEQKGITTQLDLRNKAAHGKYSEYDKSQVQSMYDYALSFILRNPL
jgi:hypothetical protein